MPGSRAKQDECWYRNPWVWLIIAIPGLTVAGCMVTIYLAITNPDFLVSDQAMEQTPAARTPRDTPP